MVDREKKNAAHGSRFTLHARLALALILASTVIPPALANVKMTEDPHAFPKMKMQEKPANTHAPVLLEADQMDDDRQQGLVVATGHVAITQGDTILLADKVTYDQQNNLVTASGHVSMLEPNGNVYFSDSTVLQDDMKAGVVQQLKARLIDNSLLVATRARKIDDNKTEMFNAVYSPCRVYCNQDGEGGSPLWSLSASDALIDQQAQKITYHSALFDVSGVPVLYTPYFSHATPGADNQSGLLTPTFIRSDNLGFIFSQPVYYSIAPDKDATLTPIYTTQAGIVMSGEYREMFNAGPLLLQGSITNAPNIDALGDRSPGHEIRGNAVATGQFRIDPDADWGFNIRRATDETYLRLYDFSSDNNLTSRIFAEDFHFADSDRSYAVIQGLSFQDLTGAVNTKTIPIVLPLTDATWQSDPGWNNSRFNLSGDALALFRNMGDESRRLSGSAGWEVPYVSEGGQVFQLSTQLRTDLYDVNDVQLSDGRAYNGVTGREVPQAALLWRYPFINRFSDSSSLTLEPIILLSATSNGGNSEKIPNEDSETPEFTDSNLFTPNRYAGLDRIETGTSASYGLRGQAQLFTDKNIDFLFGQHVRLIDDTDFPFSNDPNSRFSDYVGRLGITYLPFSIAYRYRLDKDTLALNRSEVDATFNYYPLTVNTSYLSLKDDPELNDQSSVNGNATLNLTPHWSWTVSGTEDLQLHEVNTIATGLIFKNECLSLSSMVGKDYTHVLDVKPSTNIMFNISLKNLD